MVNTTAEQATDAPIRSVLVLIGLHYGTHHSQPSRLINAGLCEPWLAWQHTRDKAEHQQRAVLARSAPERPAPGAALHMLLTSWQTQGAATGSHRLGGCPARRLKTLSNVKFTRGCCRKSPALSRLEFMALQC